MQPEAVDIFDFATTMACVIVISLAVEKPQRNCSVIQRNVLAFPRNRIHSCTCILSPPPGSQCPLADPGPCPLGSRPTAPPPP